MEGINVKYFSARRINVEDNANMLENYKQENKKAVASLVRDIKKALEKYPQSKTDYLRYKSAEKTLEKYGKEYYVDYNRKSEQYSNKVEKFKNSNENSTDILQIFKDINDIMKAMETSGYTEEKSEIQEFIKNLIDFAEHCERTVEKGEKSYTNHLWRIVDIYESLNESSYLEENDMRKIFYAVNSVVGMDNSPEEIMKIVIKHFPKDAAESQDIGINKENQLKKEVKTNRAQKQCIKGKIDRYKQNQDKGMKDQNHKKIKKEETL